MKKTTLITLDEKDVEQAIRDYIEKHHNVKINSMTVSTGVRGDYDKDNAVEYIKNVWCEAVDSE